MFTKLYVFVTQFSSRRTVMKVVEAAELLLEILKGCQKLEDSKLMLMPPNPTIDLADGYKLHISTNLGIDKETLAYIEEIVEKHGLSYRIIGNGIMIYKQALSYY